jgi:hypothetical protein
VNVFSNVDARSRSHCLRGKSISLTYSEFMCVCVCVCACVRNLSDPACKAHAQYCHLWPLRLYHAFPHCLINVMFFGGKKLLNIKCVFWFSVHLCKTFLILRRIHLHIIIIVGSTSCKGPVILHRS